MEKVKLLTTLNMADMEMELELGAGRGQLTIMDPVKSEKVVLIYTPEQAAAIWHLAIAGDSGPEALVSELYKLAEQVIAGLPRNLRPIP